MKNSFYLFVCFFFFSAQFPNGSLYISSVEENRGLTGAYQCLLTVDGIGTIVSRSARVSIASTYLNKIFSLKKNQINNLFHFHRITGNKSFV